MNRYLLDYDEPKIGPPRFMLNDVARYWRTIAVDYQAKVWEDPGPKWAMRYLKLLFSRKLAYAGALVPLLSCAEASVPVLKEAFARPPLVRLAALVHHPEFDRHDELREVVRLAEWFAVQLRDGDFRRRTREIDSRAGLLADPVLSLARLRAQDLQAHLERVFFDSALLGGPSRKYLSF